MPSFHPQAVNAGNPYGWVNQLFGRLTARLRVLESRPPTGMLNALRIDNPPPSTSSTTDVGLWRIPPPPNGSSVLIGIDAQLSGPATGEVAVLDETGGTLDRDDVPITRDFGPFPWTAGGLTVVASRTGGSGSVIVDVLAVRYGPTLADDTVSDTDSEPGQETDTPTGSDDDETGQ